MLQGDLHMRHVTLSCDLDSRSSESLDPETAFERAYESEFPRVYGYIRYRVENSETADDLTSQVFLKALDRLSTFDPRKSEIGPWMLGIARNGVRDYLRSRRRWGWLPLDWTPERTSRDPSPEQLAIGGEERQRLLEALSGLSERERDVLGLKFAGGLTNRAIARLTGLGESHVGVIVYRAVGKLRARLAEREVRHA
jgi:RNA polymerase sigma factor (sigma-70 family)